MNKKGFTLVEVLVVIGIIAIITTIISIPLFSVRDKARDAKRKNDLTQIGKFFSINCFLPDAGEGTYDLTTVIAEVKSKNPQYTSYLPDIKDPKSGTDTQSNYLYIYSADKKCALYANLENKDEKTTLNISSPTPGGGTGVFSGSPGINGTNIYFQVSN
ncbi:MAG: prepilin-type N-terminal cleavage/methylation domain-containing protein [Candidatus Falkowbacteria bacterium]|nr:prepilin-type N-terminal cleavage/methylation domain-containing protein [Candidatus Falkowbacteria bacterium]